MDFRHKIDDTKKKFIMDDSKRKQDADSIIRNHIVWSMGMGLIPIPFADFFAVSAVQLDMVRQLSRLYGLDFKETEGKALITSLTGSGLAQIGARAAAKLIPGIGSVIGGVAMSVFSGASTYAVGEVFKEHFETGGTFLDFDPGRLKKYYQEKFEKGKKVAKDIKAEEERKKKQKKQFSVENDAPTTSETKETPVKETPSAGDKSAVIAKLKELAALKDAGVITEEEFQQMKAKVISDF